MPSGAHAMGFSNPSALEKPHTVQAPRNIGLRQRAARALDGVGLVPLLARVRNLFGGRLRILAYHRVITIEDENDFPFDLDLVSASAEQFRQQMCIVRRCYEPITFRQILALLDAGRTPPRDAIVVTFDDGYDDNYRIAFPILAELGVPAVFFVSTGYIESGMPYAYDWLVHLICTARVPRVEIDALGFDAAIPDAISGRRALAAWILERLKTMSALDQSQTIHRWPERLGLPALRTRIADR